MKIFFINIKKITFLLTKKHCGFIWLYLKGNEIFLGDFRERVTPVPIPNTEVKPFIADGTAWVAMWESRTLPGII